MYCIELFFTFEMEHRCEKCNKDFKNKSSLTRHQKRKTACKSLGEKQSQSLEEPQSKPPEEINIDNADFNKLREYYDKILNADRTTYKSTNDEPTPIDCVCEMINKVPEEFWMRENLSILDPCCGNGTFAIPILFTLLQNCNRNIKHILENILVFNDINEERLTNVRKVFCGDKYNLQITNNDFIKHIDEPLKKYDMIIANPPYAKILENGKRASKNHNLIKDFIEQSLKQLNPDGYLVFITPDNWMSYADRNTLIETLTSLQIIHLDIHTAKKYFKKIGSSFTWYVIHNRPFYKDIRVSGIWKKNEYIDSVSSMKRKYIPMLYNQCIQNILSKTVDNSHLQKFEVKTSSDLHRYTKASLISDTSTTIHTYRLIHTPTQTVYASRPHKFQNGYKVFISTTDKYQVFVDNCGMTQSIVFIICESESQAKKYMEILKHPLYVFINNICRWGNFNNIRILQSFPIPNLESTDIYTEFGITPEEIEYIERHI